MQRVSLTVIAIPLILLAAVTVAISSTVTEDVFARDSGRYTGDTSQAASVSNECLNPILDSNTIDNMVGVGNCGGTVSQQDESGSASAPITSQTANPDIELQRATTTQSPGLGDVNQIIECEACFNSNLNDMQIQDFLSDYNSRAGVDNQIEDIEDLCRLVNDIRSDPGFGDVAFAVSRALVSTVGVTTTQTIIACLNNIFGSGTFPPPGS